MWRHRREEKTTGKEERDSSHGREAKEFGKRETTVAMLTMPHWQLGKKKFEGHHDGSERIERTKRCGHVAPKRVGEFFTLPSLPFLLVQPIHLSV
jgi:hypothetical protein